MGPGAAGEESGMSQTAELITDEWLAEVGFKWHQFDRQPTKHWLLWLGDAQADRTVCYCDIGLEVSRMSSRDEEWFCWFRSDAAGRYHRFIHVRHIKTQADIISLVEAITGQSWQPENHIAGTARTSENAASLRAQLERLDVKMMREGHPWHDVERDDTLGGALPEHVQVYEENRDAKE